ncbi:MAG: ATP-grasp domain-containing protein, partial [Pseudomonadota bacterium]
DLDLAQPKNGIASSPDEAKAIARALGFPLVIRPSYVLGGRAMEIVRSEAELARYIRDAVVVSGESPVLLDSYLAGAVEVDVDALADGDTVHVAGIMEHIEEAGVHSGDSACVLPPHTLSRETIEELGRQTEAMADGLGVRGLMNVQFAIKDGAIYVLEVNPRASRTVPFVAKATGVPVAAVAARIMAGARLADFTLADPMVPHVAVKEAVLPFARFPGVDTILGPEMRSTGEVMGLDRSFPRAFLKSQLGAGAPLPASGTVFVSVRDADKDAALRTAQILQKLGFDLIATDGTRQFLADNGVAVERVNKVYQGRPHIVDRMKNGDVTLVINTTEGAQSVKDSFDIRATALGMKISYYTTAAGALAAAQAIEAMAEGDLDVMALQAYAQPGPAATH